MNLDQEYDNRARVPEHPQIIDGWVKQAQKYRNNSNCDIDLAYGDMPRQRCDMFRPDRDRKGPIVIFIHGGYWKALDKSYFSHLAAGFNAHGLNVLMPSYSLCPQVHITDIITEIRLLCAWSWRTYRRKLIVTGHSAGGHLAAAMLASDWHEMGLPADLVNTGLSISGIFDLRPLLATQINAELQLDEYSARKASPLLWPTPENKRFESWVGGDESSEFIRNSATISACWSGAGTATSHVVVPDKNHFSVIEQLADPESHMVKTMLNIARIR